MRHCLGPGGHQDLAFAVACPRLVQATWVHDRMFCVSLAEYRCGFERGAGSQLLRQQGGMERQDRSISGC